MRKCSECGFQREFARYFDWRRDGTIVSTDRTGISSQITFLESGELESLFDDLSGTIGVPVDRFMVQAQKQLGKAIYANLPIKYVKRIPTNRFLRPQWLAKLTVALIRKDIAGLGDGRISLVEYRAGQSLVIKYENPCVIPMVVGGTLGIYESVEDMPSAEVDYGLDEGALVVRMRHGSERPETEARLYLEEVRAGTGLFSYERCGKCGVPLPASQSLEWDLERGIIRNRLTGQREVIVAVQSVNAMLRELENELGEDIPRVLYEAQKKLTGRHLSPPETEERGFWEDHVAGLALRGLGYPDSIDIGESVTVEMANAYNQDLYAAKIAAAFEVARSKTSRIDWRKRHPALSIYTISAVEP